VTASPTLPEHHAQLESFYAVPQLGSVVPVNYRLAGGMEYIITHSGATVLCVQRRLPRVIDGLRSRLPSSPLRGARGAPRTGWLDYEDALRPHARHVRRAARRRACLLTINYTSGTTSRPKGVMITHRNA